MLLMSVISMLMSSVGLPSNIPGVNPIPLSPKDHRQAEPLRTYSSILRPMFIGEIAPLGGHPNQRNQVNFEVLSDLTARLGTTITRAMHLEVTSIWSQGD